MVKLSLGTDTKQSEKPSSGASVEGEKTEGIPEDRKDQSRENTETVNIDEILASVGLDPYIDDEPRYVPTTMHWAYIRRVCTAQILLAMLCILFVVWAAIFMEVNKFLYLSLVAAFYSGITGLVGRCGGKKHNYCYTIFYFVLVAFQTLLQCGGWLWLVHKIYTYEKEHRGIREEAIGDHPMMYLNLGETLAMLGTTATSFCGLLACCKGFGRIVLAMDKAIHERLSQEEEKKQEENRLESQEEKEGTETTVEGEGKVEACSTEPEATKLQIDEN